jgi:hypothetical protein
MNWLFRDFLNDAEVYHNAQHYWEKLFKTALPRFYTNGQIDVNRFKNPDNDGNPIFTGVCRPLGLAVRVIQQPVGEPDDIDLDYWVEEAGFVAPNSLNLRELVIACSPSRENERQVKRVLHDWFSRGHFARLQPPEEYLPWEGCRRSYDPELCLQ